jgi:hypothetical protein
MMLDLLYSDDHTTMMKLLDVQPRPNYRLWLRYADGTEGEVDLSDLAGRGVFKLWDEPGVFEQVQIGDDGALYWNDEFDLCPDAMYLRLTGKGPEAIFPGLRGTGTDA